MSKKFGLMITSILVTLIICYLAYASKGFNETLNEYMFGYLDNFQKYLFLINILIVPFFLFVQRQINEPFIKIRLKNNVFYYILKNAVGTSFVLSIYIYFNFLFWGILFRLKMGLNINTINLIFKLFLFIFACYLFSYVIYFISNRIIFGPLSILLLNFVFLIILFAVDFFLMKNLMSETTMTIIFYIYLFVITFSSLIYLYKGAKTKECLSSKKL